MSGLRIGSEHSCSGGRRAKNPSTNMKSPHSCVRGSLEYHYQMRDMKGTVLVQPDTALLSLSLAAACAYEESDDTARLAVRDAVIECELKGWGVVRTAFTKEQVDLMISQGCLPSLEQHGVDIRDRTTWHVDRSKIKAARSHVVEHPALGKLDLGVNTDHTGVSLNLPANARGERHPTSEELMAMSPRLRAVLDEAHGGPRGRKWHIRTGVPRVLCRYPLTRQKPKFAPPFLWWHTDDPRCDPGETIGYLVMICLQTVRPGGGGTAMLDGTHKTLRKLRHWSTTPPCRKWFLTQLIAWWRLLLFYRFGVRSAISEACCEAGDLILFDPDTIHVPSTNTRSIDEFRFAFILRCNWAANDAGTGPPGIDPQWIEAGRGARQSTIHKMTERP